MPEIKPSLSSLMKSVFLLVHIMILKKEKKMSLRCAYISQLVSLKAIPVKGP
jgi:hypothetical protein